jgi:hypothetical protein
MIRPQNREGYDGVGRLRAVIRILRLEQLAKHAAELALRLAALPANGLRNDSQALDAIEQLATRILKEISAVRTGGSPAAGETRGMWRSMQPIQRH